MENDNYYEVDGDYYHEECFNDAATSILTERFGARYGVAEVDE